MTPKVPKGLIDEAEEEIEEEAVDEVAAELEALGAELRNVARDKVARKATLKKIEQLLGGLKLSDYAELADSPIVQNLVRMLGYGDLKPGQTAARGTLAERVREWTPKDMEQFVKVTFEPRETVPITFNGLSYQLQDGVEVTVPRPIYDIYMNHRYAVAQGEIHERYLQGYTDQTPDPNWIAESSAKVRAFSQMGPTPDARKRGVGFLPKEEGAASE